MMKRDSPGPSGSEPPRKRPLTVDANGKPRFKGCDGIKAYDIMCKLGEGTFGYVFVPQEMDLAGGCRVLGK